MILLFGAAMLLLTDSLASGKGRNEQFPGIGDGWMDTLLTPSVYAANVGITGTFESSPAAQPRSTASADFLGNPAVNQSLHVESKLGASVTVELVGGQQR